MTVRRSSGVLSCSPTFCLPLPRLAGVTSILCLLLGRNDRDAMLSPALLDILRRWWREGNVKGQILDGG